MGDAGPHEGADEEADAVADGRTDGRTNVVVGTDGVADGGADGVAVDGSPHRVSNRLPIPVDGVRGGAGAGAGKGKALLASVGNMFDVKARSDVEISSIGFHTYLTTTMNVTLYVRGGGT